MSIPTFDPTGLEPRSATDDLRAESPLARTPDGTWVVLGHEEALAVVTDAERFSSAASRFLQVPGGLDGAEHAALRAATDPFFGPAEMDRLAPVLRGVAAGLVEELLDGVDERGTEIDAVAALGAVFAVRAQTTWLGWPAELEPELLQWMSENHEASRSGDLSRTREVAERFDEIIRSLLAPRIAAGQDAPADPTTALLRLRLPLPDPDVPGSEERSLREEEIVSILRNWTGGDLGSIALCTGVLLAAVARAPELAERLRDGSEQEAAAIVDELLRIDDPFVSNRRVATCPVTLAGQALEEGDRVMVHWTSANRDERAFRSPDAFDPAANSTRNLVYGAGPHVCPGRPLATLELVTLLRVLLSAAQVRPAGTPGEREVAPVGGWAHAPVVLVPHR